MPLKPTKTDAKKLVELLDQEHEDVESLALAVMTKAFEVYEAKAKFTVVGQTRRTDNPAFKGVPQKGLSLGMFPTETQATAAALSLTSSNANPTEPHQVWVLPVFNGTAHQYHSERKRQRDAVKLGITSADRLSALIRSSEGPARCPHVDLDLDTLDWAHCSLARFHDGEHLPLEVAAKGPGCEFKVPIPGERGLQGCIHHQNHYGHCEAAVVFEEETCS